MNLTVLIITCCVQYIIDLDEQLSECGHEYVNVYYGSDWDIECKKCGKTKRD